MSVGIDIGVQRKVKFSRNLGLFVLKYRCSRQAGISQGNIIHWPRNWHISSTSDGVMELALSVFS